MKRFLPLSFALLFLTNICWGQSVVDTIQGDDSDLGDIAEAPTLNEETILKISPSKRIFILSNNNNSYDKGDFISLVLDNNLVNRAIVAKVANGESGIKIVKIYSLNLWNKLRVGSKVGIIRGDDSYFKLRSKKKTAQKEDFKIQDEDDLFNDNVIIEEDITSDTNEKRIIKTDNIVSAYLGFIEASDLDGNATRYNQLTAAWSYQVDDNIWAEASYGENLVKDYPSLGLDTKLSNFTIKGKYTIKAPFFSYLQPYVGFQMVTASSPGAGVQDPDAPKSQTALNEEKRLVDELAKNRIVFGVTALKRLVPGWFARADIGTDIMAIGFGLEF